MRFAVLAVFVYALAAQTPDSQVVFEVASIRQAAPDYHYVTVVGGPGANDPTRVSVENYALSGLVEMAYRIRNYELSGPDWLDEERFTVTAKLPENTTREQFRLMMRNLLSERFRLAAHFERRQARGYRLVVAKSGAKLTPSPGDPRENIDPAKPPAPFPGTTDREGYPELPPSRTPAMTIDHDRARRRLVDEAMDRFASVLAEQLHQPVVNSTGLDGKYDFVVTWSYADARPNAPPDLGPDIFTAIQEQLGLKLESEKVPVNTLVIDHIEKTPSEN